MAELTNSQPVTRQLKSIMRKKTFQITVPEPCDQKWEDMTPQVKGRFCGQCTKTIVDFSQKTDREIAAALKQSEGQLCGRFSNDQLNRDIILATALKNNSQWKATGLMLSAMLTMSACNNDDDRMTTGEIAPVEQLKWDEFSDQITIQDIQWDEEWETEQTFSQTPADIEDMEVRPMVMGMMASSHHLSPLPPSPKSKYMFALSIALILGGILLFVFVLEMIVRATI